MSIFLALSDLTWPLSCFLANEMPPPTDVAAYAAGFLPSYMLPEALGAVDVVYC